MSVVLVPQKYHIIFKIEYIWTIIVRTLSMKIDRILLFPYAIVLAVRNFFYDRGILKSWRPAIPSICVGNVTVGGTGKTPMVELLIRMYRDSRKVAVVSRGYGRRTKGCRTVSPGDSYRDVGDEPLQIKRRFPDITVVVDASRRRAIDALAALPEGERPDLVILDDAFQYRRIRPDVSILLMSASRPVFRDSLLPVGRLRDLPSQIRRADLVVVTKMEEEVTDAVRRRWREALGLYARIPLLFSRIAYQAPEPVFPEDADGRYVYSRSAVIFTGIADDSTFRREVGWKYTVSGSLKFADHHGYTSSDMSRVASMAGRYPTAMILTTEKDAQRIVSMERVPDIVRSRLFYIPIVSEIIPEEDYSRRYIEEELPGVGLMQLKNHIKI